MNGTPALAVMAVRRSAIISACTSFSMAQGPPMRASGAPPPMLIPPTWTPRVTAGLRAMPVLERRLHERLEERVRRPGPRSELRVELSRHEPRMIGQLDDLHQLLLRPDAGYAQPALLQIGKVVVVHLV